MTTLERVRAIASTLPDVDERLNHGAPCFSVRIRRPICYFHDVDLDSDGSESIWCPAPAGAQNELVAAGPARYHRPTPSASGVFAAGSGCTSTTPRAWASTGTRWPS